MLSGLPQGSGVQRVFLQGWLSVWELPVWRWCCCIWHCWTQPAASTQGYDSPTKVKKKKEKKFVLWVFYYLWLTNLGVITFFYCTVVATISLPTVLDSTVFIIQSEVSWLISTKFVPHWSHSHFQSRAHSQSEETDVFNVSLWQHTQLVAFADGEFLSCSSVRLTTESQECRTDNKHTVEQRN